jgi:quinol monooxygenase YgiN
MYTQREALLSLHTFVRFEPQAGRQQQLREELTSVIEATRAEPGCIRIQLFEAIRDPVVFYIHSEWVDEAAFDAHAKFPHMVRFLGLVGGLTTHLVKGIRTKQIG